VVIFAILQQGVEPSQELKNKIKQHIRKVLGPVATPDEIYFVPKLPKTRSGKIMRRVLKAVASGTNIGDLTTLEDGTSVDEVKKAFEELKKKV
jgi:acetyl-CoA synthetase